MLKIKMVEAEHIKRWRNIIIGNLHTRFINGMSEREFLEQYKNAPPDIVRQAMQGLVDEARAEII